MSSLIGTRWLLLLAFAALLIGCAKPKATVSRRPLPQAPPIAANPPRQPTPPRVESALHQASAKLERMIADPRNTIPDAILNRTTCFAFFSNTGGARGDMSGFVSCRNDSAAWTSPATAELRRPTDIHGDLLLFLLSQRARHRLLEGTLEFGETLSAASGPLELANPTLDPAELSKDAFAYVFDGSALKGIDCKEGVLSLNEPETRVLYGHDQDVRKLLDNSTLSSTATSFFQLDVSSLFNTITPVGIIIHHSVLLPTKELPDAERALDRFHYSRGFEISCFGKVYHIAYHYLILPSGEVHPGRPERCEGAHARGYNSYLGIALIGDFSSADNPHGKKGLAQPTKAQTKSLIKLCRRLRETYNIPLQRIMPHSAVSRTECPGDRLQFGRILAALELPSRAGL